MHDGCYQKIRRAHLLAGREPPPLTQIPLLVSHAPACYHRAYHITN